MDPADRDWTRHIVDRLDVHASASGFHRCFVAGSREQVDGFHCARVEAAFRSNGAPGYRAHGPGYYAAYLLDPDGNNVEALYGDVGTVAHQP